MGEITNGVPMISMQLKEYSSNCNLGGIGFNTNRKIRLENLENWFFT
jgi:hypothetical protein